MIWRNIIQTARQKLVLAKSPVPNQLTVVLTRRRERDEATERITYSGYDIHWPDGRSVTIGLQRFCQQGTRLLLGRARDLERAMVRVTLYPISGLEASLTKPGLGIRCKRFYSLSAGDDIRFHFFTGAPTEVIFNRRDDDPVVLKWLHSERIRQNEPFWFDLGSEILEKSEVGQPTIHLADCV